MIIIEGHEPEYTNLEGEFNIELDFKPHQAMFKKQGYQPKTVSLPFNYDEKLYVTLDSLKQEGYFDPVAIVNLAQAKRQANEQHYTSFSSDYYLRNEAQLEEVPFNIWLASGRIIPAQKDTGLIFLEEKTGHFRYKDRHHYNHHSEGINAGGYIPVPSWTELRDYDLSLFHPKIFIREVSTRGYYSPLCDDALDFYEFTAISTYYENNRKVYRIGFMPKGKKYAAFSGTMDIYDSTYTLASADYSITQGNQLELVDSLRVRQDFYYQNGEYHMASLKITYHLDIVGYAGYYNMYLFFNNQSFMNTAGWEGSKKTFEIDSTNFTTDTGYWEFKRTTPIGHSRKAILNKLNLNRQYQNYLTLNSPIWWPQKKFKFFDWVLTGHESYNHKTLLDWDPLWYSLGYNTVEGVYMNYSFPIKKVYPEKEWKISPSFRYGFNDTRLKASLSASYKFNLLKPSKLSVSGGHIVEQFNKQQPILPIINSLYSLFLSQNYLKLYGKDYVYAGYDQEIFNGLEFSSELEYAWRYPLYNTTDFSLIGNPNSFTPNNPESTEIITDEGFAAHHALTLGINLSYQFNQLYKVVMGRKINLKVKDSPKLYLNLKSGIPTSFSETDFTFIEVGVAYNIRLGNLGLSQFDVSTGGFIYQNALPFIDYKHYNGIQTFFLQPTPRRNATIKQFSTLPYYEYSTSHGYFELHYEHNFDGVLLSQIRASRRAKVHSLIGCNYLNSYNEAQFLELFIGFDNIIKVLRLEFAGGIDNFRRLRPSVRLGIDFDYLYYKNNRKK